MNIEKNILGRFELKNGEELILRKPTAEDAKDIIEYLNIVGGESDNLLFGENEFTLTVEEEIEFINNINDNPNSLMVLGIINDKISSVSQISSLNRKRIRHNSEIAISVKKEYWGLGVGSRVLQELINFAKGNKYIRNISLGVRENNINAIKLYEKCGFKKIGVHKNYFYIDGSYHNEILMDLNI